MNIEVIRERVQAGRYLVKCHAIQHAVKEGFERRHMLEAILNGVVLEAYPDDMRVLVCGKTTLGKRSTVYLHVVCEYADPVYVEIVMAYIPDESLWERPPLRRRLRKRK